MERFWIPNAVKSGQNVLAQPLNLPGGIVVTVMDHAAQAFRDTLTPPSLLTTDVAIVAVTANEHKLPLYTLDPARFAAVAGPTALSPY